MNRQHTVGFRAAAADECDVEYSRPTAVQLLFPNFPQMVWNTEPDNA